MKRRITVLLICAILLASLSGCGKISNDVITIKQYRNLDIGQLDTEGEEAEAEWEASVWEALIANCEVKAYPEDKMDAYAEDLKSQYSAVATMYGTTEEELIEKDYGIPLEKVVQNRICKELAVELIAEKEKITVTDKEYQEALERYAKEYGYQDSEVFENFVGGENLRKTLLQKEVMAFLVKHAKK